MSDTTEDARLDALARKWAARIDAHAYGNPDPETGEPWESCPDGSDPEGPCEITVGFIRAALAEAVENTAAYRAGLERARDEDAGGEG